MRQTTCVSWLLGLLSLHCHSGNLFILIDKITTIINSIKLLFNIIFILYIFEKLKSIKCKSIGAQCGLKFGRQCLLVIGIFATGRNLALVYGALLEQSPSLLTDQMSHSSSQSNSVRIHKSVSLYEYKMVFIKD